MSKLLPRKIGGSGDYEAGYNTAIDDCNLDLDKRVREIISERFFLGFIAQGYCTEKNCTKVLDSDLLVAIAKIAHKEVLKTLLGEA